MARELRDGGGGVSIWIRPERSPRGPAPERSRAEIAAAGITVADAGGLAAVTMRSAASAVGTAAASLYRYVATRDELVELMADHVYGEFSYQGASSGQPVTDLLGLAQQGLAMYRRHPWLLDVPATGNLPGPNAVAFIEHALTALAGTDLSGPAKLETIALFSGAVRLFAQAEIGQGRAGQDITQWQGSVAGYLAQVTADGRHPQLAAALAEQPSPADQRSLADQRSPADSSQQRETPFGRAMTRILTGLLPADRAVPPDLRD
jgi:AcrR family transcriptional regulator